MATKKSSSKSSSLNSIKSQANAIQKSLNGSVASGQIKSGSGSKTTKPTTTTTPSRDQQINNLKTQAQGLQNTLNSSVTSGQITGGRVENGRVVSSSKPPITPPVTTPTTPTAPGTKPTSYADQYYKDIMSSLTPSKDENKLQDQQTALDAQLRNLDQGQGVMNQNIADQPIALPFITGQQKAIENRYALQRSDVQNQQQTLAQQLANEQSKRQSAIDIAKVGVDYGQGLDNLGIQQSKTTTDAQRYQDQLTQQTYENTTGASQYQDKLKQQTYENTTGASQYQDKLKQQTFDNSIAQQKANRQSSNVGNRGTQTERTRAAMKEDLQALEVSRGSDGFVNTSVYIEGYRNWMAMGRSLPDFLKNYPPEKYVNPNDQTVPSYLKPKKTSRSG